jgi:thioredoxin 1
MKIIEAIMLKSCISIVLIALLSGFLSCTGDGANSIEPFTKDSTVKITFVEFAASTCVPCLKMRPVMDSIQKKYGNQILVKFIDVIKEAHLAKPYKIRLMPTQVFLDSNNIEIHRHEGFYSEDSIHIFLQSKGLKIL